MIPQSFNKYLTHKCKALRELIKALRDSDLNLKEEYNFIEEDYPQITICTIDNEKYHIACRDSFVLKPYLIKNFGGKPHIEQPYINRKYTTVKKPSEVVKFLDTRKCKENSRSRIKSQPKT